MPSGKKGIFLLYYYLPSSAFRQDLILGRVPSPGKRNPPFSGVTSRKAQFHEPGKRCWVPPNQNTEKLTEGVIRVSIWTSLVAVSNHLSLSKWAYLAANPRTL